MPVTQDPGPVTIAGLEALASLNPDPDYVVAYTPPRAYKKIRDRLTKTGLWELLPVDVYYANDHAIEEWTWDAPRDTPVADLTAWVTRLLGLRVALQPDPAPISIDRPFALRHTEPRYWVLPNS